MQGAWCSLCQILTRSGVSEQIFVKVSNIKFHENLSSGSRTDTCGRTDMTNLIGGFRERF